MPATYHTPREKREHDAWLELMADRELAERVPCPDPPLGCGVSAGQTCINPLTGKPPRYPAHRAREQLAAATTNGATADGM